MKAVSFHSEGIVCILRLFVRKNLLDLDLIVSVRSRYPVYTLNMGKVDETTIRESASLQEKEDLLAEELRALVGGESAGGKLAIAFSGGVDSTFLLAFAHQHIGDRAIAFTAQSAFFPRSESSFTKRFCEEHAIVQHIFDIDVLSESAIAQNPPDRCYNCKRLIFTKMMDAANDLGCVAIADGTNADDDYDDRPGMRALDELGVKSPLRDVGLTKDDIRHLSRKLHLPTSDKPSLACLATRISHGVALADDDLRAVERSEEVVRSLGFEQCRVRIDGEGKRVARIEVSPDKIEQLISEPIRKDLDEKLRSIGFERVSLDLRGYGN